MYRFIQVQSTCMCKKRTVSVISLLGLRVWAATDEISPTHVTRLSVTSLCRVDMHMDTTYTDCMRVTRQRQSTPRPAHCAAGSAHNHCQLPRPYFQWPRLRTATRSQHSGFRIFVGEYGMSTPEDIEERGTVSCVGLEVLIPSKVKVPFPIWRCVAREPQFAYLGLIAPPVY